MALVAPRVAAAVLVLLLLAGCTGTAPTVRPTDPWPATWETSFCVARESLSIAANRLAQGVTSGSNSALDGARVNARDVGKRVDQLQAWPAGDAVRAAYGEASTEIILAVGIAMVALIGEASPEEVAAATGAATATIHAAIAAYDALSSATGFRCAF